MKKTCWQVLLPGPFQSSKRTESSWVPWYWEITTGFAVQQAKSPAACSQDGCGGHLQHMGFLSCTGIDNSKRTLVTWQGLQPQAGYCGVQHGHGSAKHKQRFPGPQSLSFPPPRADKTVCHLLITLISTTRLYLIQTQHLTTANLQDESCLSLLLPFM